MHESIGGVEKYDGKQKNRPLGGDFSADMGRLLPFSRYGTLSVSLRSPAPPRGELFVGTGWQITKKLPLSGELDANEVSRLRGSSFLIFRRDILSEVLFAQGL